MWVDIEGTREECGRDLASKGLHGRTIVKVLRMQWEALLKE